MQTQHLPNAEQATTSSLQRPHVAFFLKTAADDFAHAQQLHAMFSRRRDESVETDAVWSGHWALKSSHMERTEQLRLRGGLLFLHQPPALAASQQICRGE